MQSINVTGKGDKVYSVIKGVPRPTKATRERDGSKAKYEFNTMEDNDFLYAGDEKERNAISQAFKSKVYEAARQRGYLFTRNLAKCDKATQEAAGKTTGFGIWFTAYTPEELAANVAKEGEKA